MYTKIRYNVHGVCLTFKLICLSLLNIFKNTLIFYGPRFIAQWPLFITVLSYKLRYLNYMI